MRSWRSDLTGHPARWQSHQRDHHTSRARMIKYIIKELDRLEDRVRQYLSKRPLLYALIAGVGVVLFWRGVWDIADILMGPATSLIASLIIMLLTGTFVSFFI